ncbi:MAG TPA: hypothetical protein VJ691_16700, partial [Vicinamibacterales bacterium]|nr:hypothetical protein [Vicinamibacterales bacterium]
QAADTTLQNNVNAEAATRAAADQTLQNNIDAISQPAVPQNLLDFAQFLTIDASALEGMPGPHVILSGVNLHLRNDSKFRRTYADPDGTGNLVIGFNEAFGYGEWSIEDVMNQRGGSHNLIIGEGHRYPMAGGLVAGAANGVTAHATSVLGGQLNDARYEYSTVLGSINQFTQSVAQILP